MINLSIWKILLVLLTIIVCKIGNRIWGHQETFYWTFYNLYQNRANYFLMLTTFGLLFFSLVLKLQIKFFGELREIEKITMIDKTRVKFIDLAFSLMHILFGHDENEQFKALKFSLLIVFVANIKWLISMRIKAICSESKFISPGLRIFAFNI